MTIDNEKLGLSVQDINIDKLLLLLKNYGCKDIKVLRVNIIFSYKSEERRIRLPNDFHYKIYDENDLIRILDENFIVKLEEVVEGVKEHVGYIIKEKKKTGKKKKPVYQGLTPEAEALSYNYYPSEF